MGSLGKWADQDPGAGGQRARGRRGSGHAVPGVATVTTPVPRGGLKSRLSATGKCLGSTGHERKQGERGAKEVRGTVPCRLTRKTDTVTVRMHTEDSLSLAAASQQVTVWTQRQVRNEGTHASPPR